MTTPLAGLQRTLAAEHAAVYVYGVLGGRTSVSGTPALADQVRAAYATHRDRRDALVERVAGHGGEPVAAHPGYAVRGPVRTPHQVRAQALLIEQRCAATYADLAGSTSGDDRSWAIGALTDSALRELDFGGEPRAFPGLPEQAGESGGQDR